MYSSDSDSESEWNREMFIAVAKKQGKGRKISEQDRCRQIQDCIDQGANINALDENGNTVLDVALIKGYHEVVSFLRQCGTQAAGVGSQLDSGAERLASNLDKLDIAKVSSHSIEQQSKEAHHRPTTVTIDNEQPSTSGNGNRSGHDSSSSRSTLYPKHKLTTDNEHDVLAKKPRLMLGDISQHEIDKDDVIGCGNTGIRSISSDEDLNSEENEERTVQTVSFNPNETYAASGLKQTLHGIVYQWKHLMLILNRAWKKGYSFRLSTEMDAAEKFDDVVLEYVDSKGHKTHRFVQLKHKKDDTKMITARDLLDVKDGDFSVLKYFVSWRKIKECSGFDGSNSKTFTLCTNIGLDLEGLRKVNIDVSLVRESDDFLKIANRNPQPPRYILQVSRQSELYQTLKLASDVHRLATELAERSFGSKDIYLNTDIIKRYHAALAQDVIDVRNQRFTTNFIKGINLSVKAKNFRVIFLFHAKKLFKRNASEAEIWKGLTDNKLKISTNFGTKFELSTNPELTHVVRFSDEFVKLVNNASTDNVVKIDRRIYSKRASELSVERIFADNIDKLAGHVLITENKKIKFSSRFLNDVTQLLGNMEEFRDLLRTRLGSKFDELDKFEFEINNFKTCTEEELSSSSVTELPDDDIIDGEILDFLDGFVLAVEQPDERELGEIIRQEIGESWFDLPDAKFFTDSFQIEILNWFKETGKQSVFLANENARDIFNEIEGRLSSLVTMDLRSEYPEKLEKLDIEFERENIEFWKFIRSPHPSSDQIFVIFSGQTLLTALRVYQTLKPLQRIGCHDGFIFLRLDRLFETKILDQVLRTFEWRDDNNLLVIDCASVCVQQYTQELWNPVCRIMKRNDKKKMVLIVQGTQDETMKFRTRYNCIREDQDNFSIVNLRKFSQQKLLDRRIVKFQGREENFRRLLRIRNSDNIGLQKLEHLKRLINSDVLVQLIKGNEIQIGSDVQGLGPIQDYYIPRRIVRRVIIQDGIMKASGISDLFAISDTDKEVLRKLLGNKARLRSFDENSQAEPDQSECIILSNGEAVNQFESLCERNMNRNIHWFQCASGRFIWIRSFGDKKNLFKYRDVSESADHEEYGPDAAPNENKLVDHDAADKIVIFSDTAGMGKSTVLTSLAERMKDNASGHGKDDEAPLFMIRINLTHRTTVLAEEKENRSFDCNNIDGAVEFLVDKLSGIGRSDDLTSRFYKTMIENDGEAILFVDGFDEISPTYEHIVTDLLQALVKMPIKKLFVTTRPHTSEELEKLLGTFSHRLQPFSLTDQRDFLIKFWKTGMSKIDYNEALEKRLKMHAEGVIKLLARSISPQMTEFTGIPLQTRMVAEIYQYKETATEDQDGNQLKLPEKIDIIDLYQKFLEKKYDEFYTEKQPGDPTNLAARQSRADGNFISTLKHQKFALDALFKEEAARLLLDSQPGIMDLIKRYCRYNEGVERAGIIVLNVEGKPHFVHRTFAEYFVATFLIETLKLLSQNYFLLEFFLTEFAVASQYKTIRAFLNCHLSREACVIEESSKHLDLCNFHGSREHETVYYVGAIERNFEIVKFFLNYLIGISEDNVEQHKTVINLSDFTGRTPLTVSIENSCDLIIVKCFIERGVDVNWKNFRGITVLHTAVEKPGDLPLVKYLCDEGADINYKNQKRETPLHYATRHNKNFNVVKYLCDKGADVNSRETWGATPLHYAARHSGNLEVIKYLCDKSADVSIRNDEKETPLHLAVRWVQNLDVVKYLCDQGADINSQCGDGKTPLHLAADDTRKFDVVKYLCDKGASMDCQDREKETPLHVAARTPNNLDIVKNLCDKGANLRCKGKNNQSPLHCAALQAGNLSVVKYLCEKGADVNCRDEDGDTPLHHAVRHAANFEVVKYLCDNGASINCQQRLGYTPLHYAADKVGELKVVKYLCEKGADVNIRTQFGGETALHRAAHRAGNFDVVEYLCEKGASINCQAEQLTTPLHNAARFAGDLAIIKYLCERGADVNCKDDYDRTPLYYAANSDENLDLVEYLCEIGANVNFPDKLGDTALHQAARFLHNINVVKYLCGEGASINCQNEKGETPLHFAADKTGSLDVVQYLCENGASINCQNKLGAIPLHEAAHRSNNLDVVKYLCENGADINRQLSWGWTPLHSAADNVENFEIVKYLCDEGADVNCQGNDGETPLFRAALQGNLDMVKYLCEKGADVNCKNSSGETPLYEAIVQAISLEIVEYLIDKGADINARTRRGVTPLLAAAELGQWHIIQYLIGQGADASITDNDGNTPLFLARYRCSDSDQLRQAFGDIGNVDDICSTGLTLSFN